LLILRAETVKNYNKIIIPLKDDYNLKSEGFTVPMATGCFPNCTKENSRILWGALYFSDLPTTEFNGFYLFKYPKENALSIEKNKNNYEFEFCFQFTGNRVKVKSWPFILNLYNTKNVSCRMVEKSTGKIMAENTY
jgi:hypothetical protein